MQRATVPIDGPNSGYCDGGSIPDTGTGTWGYSSSGPTCKIQLLGHFDLSSVSNKEQRLCVAVAAYPDIFWSNNDSND